MLDYRSGVFYLTGHHGRRGGGGIQYRSGEYQRLQDHLSGGFDMSFVDNDTTRIETVSRADKTKITKAFLDTIEAAGYKPLLYGDKEWLIKEIDLSKLSAYDVWLSQMEDVPDYPYRFTMWQYANDVTIDGIAGYANMNISFIDYSEK